MHFILHVIGNMALNTLMLIMSTIMLSIFVVPSYTNEQNKPGKLNKLCGNDFIWAHQDCCNNDCVNIVQSGVVEVLEKRGG